MFVMTYLTFLLVKAFRKTNFAILNFKFKKKKGKKKISLNSFRFTLSITVFSSNENIMKKSFYKGNETVTIHRTNIYFFKRKNYFYVESLRQ